MTDVFITFNHKCKDFVSELYEIKNFGNGWDIVEDLDDDYYEILSNIKFCPYCGEKLK